MAGCIYVLTNECMPGLVKIGRTHRDCGVRKNELFTTGVPVPFDVAAEVKCLRPDLLEYEVHTALSEFRVSENREFFKCAPEIALDVLEQKNLSLLELLVKDVMPGYVVTPAARIAQLEAELARLRGEAGGQS